VFPQGDKVVHPEEKPADSSPSGRPWLVPPTNATSDIVSLFKNDSYFLGDVNSFTDTYHKSEAKGKKRNRW